MSKKEQQTIKEKVLETVEKSKTAAETTQNEPPKEEGSFKIKKVTKPKQLGEDKLPEIIKVDLSKTKKEEKDAIPVGETRDLAKDKQAGDMVEVEEPVRESSETNKSQEEKIESDSPLQEITDEEDVTDKKVVDTTSETNTTSTKEKKILQEDKTQELPENVEKLVKFMKETGGTVEDYAKTF